ncbi:MAG: endonuclease/exonuclease/phosphatase family protein [Chitinophagaceae bacterium]|nr:endonuclease/exonuclease/phosphatase family protein [Chitinophagaceae bacterium]
MKKFFKYFLLLTCILAAILFASCRLIPSINPYEQSFIGILGLLTPVLLVVNVLFFIFWLVMKKFWYALIPLVAFVFCWNVFSVMVGGHLFNQGNTSESTKQFSLMSYNVRLLDLYNWSGKKTTRNEILSFFKEQNPTVLCLQEFYSGNDTAGVNNIQAIVDSCNYEYYAECNVNVNKRGKWGSIIFSHLPIVQSENHDVDVAGNNMLQQANLLFQKDTVSIFNLHLKSNRFSISESALVSKKELPEFDDKTFEESKSIYNKLEHSTINRGLEADLVTNIIQQNSHPSIICGDLNDIPSSYVYFKIRGDKKDAFLEKGFGLGATYNQTIPLLRIDYLFYSNQLRLHEFENLHVTYSDHYPLLANFSL